MRQPISPNARVPTNRAGLLHLLDEMVKAEATHLHLKVPSRPHLRIGDRLSPLPYDRLTPEETLHLANTLSEFAGETTAVGLANDARVSFGVEGLGRFRAQLARQRGSLVIVIHRIPTEAPSLAELGASEAIGRVMDERWGLVLVGGGRRRRDLLSAMVRHYNEGASGHLVSFEDPIAHLHRDARAAVSQREVGTDVASLVGGLRAARRLDPDVVVVDDVPDADSAEELMRAAEEGLLVVAGLPAVDAGSTETTFLARLGPSGADRLRDVLRMVVIVPPRGPVG